MRIFSPGREGCAGVRLSCWAQLAILPREYKPHKNARRREKQIVKMRELYDLLPVKPEWLTREQIDEYAARMNVNQHYLTKKVLKTVIR